MSNALEVRGLTVRRDTRRAIVDSVNLEVGRGECLAIVGRSGAGKSVLARTLLGLTQQEPGWRVQATSFRLGSQDVSRASARQWRKLRGIEVSLVLQDALQSLDPLRTIGAEVSEVLAVHGIARGRRRELVLQALTQAGLSEPDRLLQQRSQELSGGMRQRALIAAALVGDPEIVVADEPTTALDSTSALQVVDLLGEIRDQGKGLVFISHDLTSVSRIADRIAVMDRGRIVEVGPAHRVLNQPRHQVTQAMLRASHDLSRPSHSSQTTMTPIISVVGVTKTFPVPGGHITAVDHVDLQVGQGRSLGIVGESGSGKTTLARILIGAESPDNGSVSHNQDDVRVRLIPQDPLGSFDPRWKVGRIVAASLRPGAGTVTDILASVGLGADFLTRRPADLSGGERQRVAIARALAARPDVLVCDEPVSALDTVTQAGVLAVLRDLQRSYGMTIVFISHDLRVVSNLCRDVAVMEKGRIVEYGRTDQVMTNPQQAFTAELVRAARLGAPEDPSGTFPRKRG